MKKQNDYMRARKKEV